MGREAENGRKGLLSTEMYRVREDRGPFKARYLDYATWQYIISCCTSRVPWSFLQTINTLKFTHQTLSGGDIFTLAHKLLNKFTLFF